MNYPLLFRLLSLILVALSAAFATSMAVGWLMDDSPAEMAAIRALAWTVGLSLTLAITFGWIGRNAHPRLFRKEAFALIGVGWILASLLGAVPYYLTLNNVSFGQAFFESTSGLTTTGASCFTGFEQWPRSLLFWRQLSQWIGGLGVVVFFVAVLSSLGAGAKILFSNESTGTSTDVDSSRIQTGALRILQLYIGLSALCALALHLAGLSWYDAVCHTFTTISTGGFSTRSSSIEAFANPTAEWVFITFMILGGTSFLVILKGLNRDFRTVRQNTETWIFWALIPIFSLMVFFYIIEIQPESDFGTDFRIAVFQVVSILTTTGYSSINYGAWTAPAQLILLSCMVIGGSSGSTAGGVKVVRFVVACKIALQAVEKAFRTKVVRPLRINGRILTDSAQVSVLTYIVTLGLIGTFSMVVVSVLEHNLDLASVVSGVFACLQNIGPAFGQLGPAEHYGALNDLTHVYLALLMIVGRLEIFAVLVLFSPSLWRQYR
ncbi:MAG: TrkH family potassium uptake protein [Opitutales bacterium]